MTWASAAQAAEDAALRWAAAVDVAHDPVPAQLGAAVGGADSIISQAAAAALTAAISAARVRVDLVHHLYTGTATCNQIYVKLSVPCSPPSVVWQYRIHRQQLLNSDLLRRRRQFHRRAFQ